MKHHIMNLQIDTNFNEANAKCYFVAVTLQDDQGLESLGNYLIKLRKKNNSWKIYEKVTDIKARTIRPLTLTDG